MILGRSHNILAISGSLRAASSNTAILQAAKRLAPARLEVVIFEGLGELPHFNPDFESEPPTVILEFQRRLRASSAVMISSPEYAHGVPGTLKNALDWVVGSGELVGKPTALFGVTARGEFAQASLRETLTVMTASLIEGACVDIPLPGRNATASEIVANLECSSTIVRAFMEIEIYLESRSESSVATTT
jgi:chromate reductase, NAD(P)H dehydrogenase (quinone)